MFKFSIERETLLTSLLLVIGAVDKRNTLPVLSNVLLDLNQNMLTLSGTDTEIEFTSRLVLVGSDDTGRITVPARKFIDICRSLNEGAVINISAQTDRVLVTSGRSRFVLMSLPADDYPATPDEQPILEFQIETRALIDILQVTHFSMAQQDVRFYLNGLLIELLNQEVFSVSTDGHRLAVARVPLDTPIMNSKMILPRKGVLELLRLINEIKDEMVLIQQTESHFYLKTCDYQFISKLVSGRFPNYKRVLPIDNDKFFLVDRDLFKQTLSRVSILANEKYRAITLDISERKLVMNAINKEQEEAVEELEVDTQGEGISIGVNASYIIDVLNTVPPGLVKLSFSEPDKSILLESLNLPIASYVIMPLKI
tara:strand:+ start:761 stop:1867 length:1107 start_codon:yes stop_codon:yes gene_type:complete